MVMNILSALNVGICSIKYGSVFGSSICPEIVFIVHPCYSESSDNHFRNNSLVCQGMFQQQKTQYKVSPFNNLFFLETSR